MDSKKQLLSLKKVLKPISEAEMAGHGGGLPMPGCISQPGGAIWCPE